MINSCSTAVPALHREWCLFLCPGECGDHPGAPHSHPGMTVALAGVTSHLSDWCIADDDCKMLLELLSAKRVNISISATDNTVQTPMKYPYIYVFTNPTKPLKNSSIGFQVTPAAGVIPLLLPFFLPCPILLRYQSVLESFISKQGLQRLFLIHSFNMQYYLDVQASTFFTHLRLLIPNAWQHCPKECYPSGRGEGMCGLLLVSSLSSIAIRNQMQMPERMGRRHRCSKSSWYRSRTGWKSWILQ